MRYVEKKRGEGEWMDGVTACAEVKAVDEGRIPK